MRFKIFAMGFLFVLSACGGESHRVSKNVDVRLKGETGECLGAVGDKVRSYIKAELNDAQVTEIWACLDGALSDFVNITSPEHPNGYPPDALARFFEKFFLKRDVPLSVADALMNLKRILVGGEREFLTLKEVTKLKIVIQKSQSWSLRLNPHLSALFLNEPTTVTQESLEAAFAELERVGFEIGMWLEEQNQSYSQKDIHDLLLSLKNWLDPRGKEQLLNSVLESLPLFFDLKSILIGGGAHEMRAEEWTLFFRKASAVFNLVQIFNAKHKTNSIPNLVMDESVSGLTKALITLFLGVNVPYADVESLIGRFSQVSWWPRSLPAEGLSEALKFFFQKFLGVDRGKTDLTVDHRVVVQLENLRRSYHSYLRGENADFEDLLSIPLRSDARGVIYFDRLNRERASSYERYQLAAIYSLVIPLYANYKTDRMSLERFEYAFSEILEILKSLNLFGDIDPGMSRKLFREMGVFSLASDGDAYLSEKELVIYVWMVLSAYNQERWVLSQLGVECGENSDCVQRAWRENHQTFLYNFPQVTAYLSQLSPQRRDEFFDLAVEACGSNGLLMNVMILSYLESFMIRYDDGDSVLNTEEVLNSYVTFGPVLEDLLGGVGVSPDDTLAFFTYLFNYGYTPLDSRHTGAMLRFVHWKLYPNQWNLTADRMRLLQILSELSKL